MFLAGDAGSRITYTKARLALVGREGVLGPLGFKVLGLTDSDVTIVRLLVPRLSGSG